MNRAYLSMVIGVGLLASSLGLVVLGSSVQSLALLVASFVLGIAGAVVALRGVLEFLGERL